MKEGRRAGGITSGPESKILEGGGWDETRVLDDGSVVRPVTPGYGGYGGGYGRGGYGGYGYGRKRRSAR